MLWWAGAELGSCIYILGLVVISLFVPYLKVTAGVLAFSSRLGGDSSHASFLPILAFFLFFIFFSRSTKDRRRAIVRSHFFLSRVLFLLLFPPLLRGMGVGGTGRR